LSSIVLVCLANIGSLMAFVLFVEGQNCGARQDNPDFALWLRMNTASHRP
jgi:hypothetical protein